LEVRNTWSNEVTLAEILRSGEPDLVADLWLYPMKNGGRKSPIRLGWGCPCFVKKDLSDKEGWSGYPMLGDQEMNAGQSRRVGFVFLSGDMAAAKLKTVGKFYLWDGPFIGEAVVVSSTISN
jgi:hypothetical protein